MPTCSVNVAQDADDRKKRIADVKSQINEPFCTRKPNWAESRQHYVDWWNHTGLVIGGWGTPPLPVPHDPTPVPPPPPGGYRACFEDVEWRAQQAFAWLDYPSLHLDGTQCLCHLDHILDIESLKAVEWTPNTDEPGQHERWR